jgi:hypothetical protein
MALNDEISILFGQVISVREDSTSGETAQVLGLLHLFSEKRCFESGIQIK